METQLFHDAETAAAYLIDSLVDNRELSVDEMQQVKAWNIDIRGITDYVRDLLPRQDADAE